MSSGYNKKCKYVDLSPLASIVKTLWIAAILISFSSMATADNSSEQILLLNLKYKVDKTVAKEIKFYGNRINPNINAINDNFSISIDGEFINAPKSVYGQLHNLRKSFSYDELSGGILQASHAKGSCLLAGAEEGFVLEALYLTLNPDTFKPVNNEMKPILGLAINCLFSELYSPLDPLAREDARAAIETLKTIYLIYSK
jgi:hypothetical protein